MSSRPGLDVAHVPAAVLQAYGLLAGRLDTLVEYFESKLEAQLQDLNPLTVLKRKKSPESICQKLQTGKYAALCDLDDLLGFTVVLRTRTDVFNAFSAVGGSELSVTSGQLPSGVMPTDFRYREPKLILRPTRDYLQRRPELDAVNVEVQFTTALQYALDVATHDFDYKGADYDWSKFRVVAQVRAMLELADTMIDDMGKGVRPTQNRVSASDGFESEQEYLEVLSRHFDSAQLPRDMRRLADTVKCWCDAVDWSAQRLSTELSGKISSAGTFSPAEQVLDRIASTQLTALLERFHGSFFVSAESLDFASALHLIPESRRVCLVLQ